MYMESQERGEVKVNLEIHLQIRNPIHLLNTDIKRKYGLAKKVIQLMNTLFNEVLGENEKCLLLLLKTERTFWPIQYYRRKAELAFCSGLFYNMKSNTFVFKLSENLYKLSFPQALHCHSSLLQRFFSLLLSLLFC